jgi:hypothetical protein
VADDDKELDGMGPLDDDALTLLPLLLRLLLVLITDDEPKGGKLGGISPGKKFMHRSYPFPLIVVVKLALDFAATTRKIRELEANFDSIDSPRDWVVSTRIDLAADNILLL